MTTSIENITSKIVESYSYSLSENERINNILDHINDTKQEYILISKNLNKLSKLLIKITWLENLTISDEIIIKGVLTIGKGADKQFKKFYAIQKKTYAPKGWFKKDFEVLKSAINFHNETIADLEHIIFDLRKNKDFQLLCNELAVL